MADDKKPKSDLLELVNSRLSLARRFSKKWQDNVKKWEMDYNIETLVAKKTEGIEDRNLMQIPYIFNTIESELPSIFQQVPAITMKQRGKKDKDFTDFANAVWDYIKSDSVTKMKSKLEDAGINFLVTGLGVISWGWILETEMVDDPQDIPVTNEDGSPVLDENGNPVVQQLANKVEVPIVDMPYVETYPWKDVMFSPESAFVQGEDNEGKIPYIICRALKTSDEIKYDYKFDKKVEVDTPSYLTLKEFSDSMSLEDLDDKNLVKKDLERTYIYKYYGVLPKKMVDDENWKPRNVYYMAFTPKQIIKEPERIDKKPLTLIGNYGLPSLFWRFGEPKAMRELEQDVSLGRSRVMDLRDKQGTKIALPQGTEVDERALKRPADYTIMRFIGTQPPVYVTPPPIPETVMTGIQQSREDIQMLAAQLNADSALDTAYGQRQMQAGTDKKTNRKKDKIGEALQSLAKNLLILCAQNWDIDKFAEITDMEVTEIEQMGFLEKLQNLGTGYDVEIDVENVTNNKEVMAAQAIALYRESKDDPLINREEIIKEMIKVGFGKTDAERFLSENVTPDQVIKVLEHLMQIGAIEQSHAEGMILAYREAMGVDEIGEAGVVGKVGRPPSKDATAIMEKSIPAANNEQVVAQTNAAYKQTGVPKGRQSPVPASS